MNVLKIGDSGISIYWLRKSLNYIESINLSSSNHFDDELEDAISRFQSNNGLLVDGEVGIFTIGKLSDSYIRIIKSNYGDSNGLIKRDKAPADKFKNGYESFNLRGDVADAARQVYNVLKTKGAILTSAGGFREISTKATDSSMSKSSLHYTGRALDMAVSSGMENPRTDPYIITSDDGLGRNGNRLHRVYAKSDIGDEMTLTPITYDKPLGAVKLTDKFVDLTKIMLDHGFERIKAKSRFYDTQNFSTSDRYKHAEWWHFQYQIGLFHGHSTFGNELELVWLKTQLEKTETWQSSKSFVFGVNWG